MRLSEDQVRQFQEEGWLFLPETFSAEEGAVLRDEAEAIYAANRPDFSRQISGRLAA